MYLKNKKLLFSFILSISLLYYLFFSIPANLNDDHGIMINAGLQVSQGSFPGFDFTYPHGILPPLILGLFFKFFQFFNIGWQFPYFLISSILFLFFVYILVEVINNIFDVSRYHSALISLILVSLCLNAWGGIYFDYISINLCFLIIHLFFLGFNYLEESNRFTKNIRIIFFALGLLIFINPFLVKLTSIYISVATGLTLLYLILFNKKFSKFKKEIFFCFSSGFLIIPFLIILKFTSNFQYLNFIILNILDPVLNADDLATYSLIGLPYLDFVIPLFSLLALSIFLILFNSKLYKNTFLIYKLLTIFLIFQYLQAWGRSRYWVIIAIIFYCIKILIDKNKLLINKNQKLLISIIFSSLAFLNISEFIRINKRIIIRQKRFANNSLLDFKNTNLSFFKIKEDTNWGISSDVVQVGKIIKSRLENKEILTYSYFDDNAFLIPLITGIKPLQNYTFFQINKTIFKNKVPNINNFNLGRPDNLVICLPLKSESLKLDTYTLIKNQLNYDNFTGYLPKYNSERYIRVKKIDNNFEIAKKIFLGFTDIYIKKYKVSFSNKSCIILERDNQLINQISN